MFVCVCVCVCVRVGVWVGFHAFYGATKASGGEKKNTLIGVTQRSWLTHTCTQPPTHAHAHTHTHTRFKKRGIMSYICRCEWRAIFSYPVSLLCIMWSKKWALPFDVCSDPVCFPSCAPSWLLELVGLFTGLHNELLIIPGPHRVSPGPQLSLLLTQVGMVTRRGWDLSGGGHQKDRRHLPPALFDWAFFI